MYAIDIQELDKRYGSTQALQNFSLQVQPGELFGLIGPDGAGKTTLMRIIASLLLPDRGRLRVLGLNPVLQYKKLRLRIGYMPGRFSLYQDLSVEENLRFFATVFGTTIEANYALIEDIYKQIEPFRTRPAGKLSGGMKQKLALSCALIHKPDLLLLDEPTTGVDAVSRKEFWEMLRKLRQAGITMLVSTPYMDEAALCDRVALMQQGRILRIDTPQQIVDTYDRPLLAARADQTYELIQHLRQHPAVFSAYPFGEFVHVALHHHSILTAPQLADELRQARLTHVVVQAQRPSIEDCFMELMSKPN